MSSREDSVPKDTPDKGGLRARAASATRWSLATEVTVKLISPLTQLLLARILAPEAFGVVATVTMVTSFADMLSDAGFQKYLIQHEFDDEDEFSLGADVAFWTNLVTSLALWVLVIIFRDPLAAAVGSPGLGLVLVVACVSFPLTALSSIQLAVYHRNLEFKGLFPVRISVALVPLVVTVPLALAGVGYWALIIGNIVGNLVNATILTVRSTWKPRQRYRFQVLRQMFSFSAWTLFEQFSIWLTSWAGTFIVGTILSQYYLGLYRTSITIVNSAMGVVTSATTPVLFAELSRLQRDRSRYEKAFLGMQRKVAFFVMPLGVGIFAFRDFATEVLLGPQWSEASLMLGLWALSSSVVIMLSHYASEVYRSMGMPKLSLCCQLAYLAVFIPVTYVSAQLSFQTFAVASSLVRIAGVAISLFALKAFVGFSSLRILGNVGAIAACSAAMGIIGMVLHAVNSDFALTILWIFLCITVYLLFCIAFRSTRNQLLGLIRIVRNCVGK